MSYKKISGVYKIFCSGNGKVYVGSAVCIKGRWATHRSALSNNIHTNRHLQNSFNKYGLDSFEFSIIDRCDKKDLIGREQFWIDHYDAANPDLGLNNSPTASTSIGFRHSEATKLRLSELAKARDHTRIREMAHAMRGKPSHNKGKPGQKWTPEMRLAASFSRKGRTAWNRGIPHREETKAKISAGVMVNRRTIGDDKRREIMRLRSDGLSYPKIAKLTGISIAQSHRIANGIVGGMRTFEKAKNVEGNR